MFGHHLQREKAVNDEGWAAVLMVCVSYRYRQMRSQRNPSDS